MKRIIELMIEEKEKFLQQEIKESESYRTDFARGMSKGLQMGKISEIENLKWLLTKI